jgi:hypothetical protein
LPETPFDAHMLPLANILWEIECQRPADCGQTRLVST